MIKHLIQIQQKLVPLALLAAVALVGCSDEDHAPSDEQDSRLAISCHDSQDIFYDKPSNLPAFEPSRRGDVVRCGPYGKFSLDSLRSTATKLGYTGGIMNTGVTAYRVAYRTERSKRADGTTPAGIATALVFLPDKPRAADGKMPLVVLAHGTIGIGTRCAPSRGNLTTPDDHLDDDRSLIIPLVAAGWVVIAPDYSGYGYGQTTSYGDAEDAAHGLLDATRAATHMFTDGMLSGEVIFVGHSQGGHAVLSAEAFAKSYGMDGHLAGVAAMAPLWFSPLAFPAMISPFAGFTTADNSFALSYALDYFYTHGENLDGPGHGTDMIQPDKRKKVREIATNDCVYEAADHMSLLGKTPGDFFDKTFADEVGMCGISGSCQDGDAQVWGARCRKDRPKLDPNGPPVVLWFGGKDQTITPSLAVCALENIRAGLSEATNPTTKVQVCVDRTATHSGFLQDEGIDMSAAITRRSMDWVDQWIAARTIGGSEPAPCEGEEAFTTDAGPVTCSTPPPND